MKRNHLIYFGRSIIDPFAFFIPYPQHWGLINVSTIPSRWIKYRGWRAATGTRAAGNPTPRPLLAPLHLGQFTEELRLPDPHTRHKCGPETRGVYSARETTGWVQSAMLFVWRVADCCPLMRVFGVEMCHIYINYYWGDSLINDRVRWSMMIRIRVNIKENPSIE